LSLKIKGLVHADEVIVRAKGKKTGTGELRIEKPSPKLLENSLKGEHYLERNTFLAELDMDAKGFQIKSSPISLDITAGLTISSSTDYVESVNSSTVFQLLLKNMD
jgi:hypothetical protein